jgi:hypothetical protein
MNETLLKALIVVFLPLLLVGSGTFGLFAHVKLGATERRAWFLIPSFQIAVGLFVLVELILHW